MKKKKLYTPKCLENIEYKKELHHMCLNSQICKTQIQPCDECAGCKFYKLEEVEVADNPIRFNIDWGF